MDDYYTSLLVAFERWRFLGGAPPPALLKFLVDNDFRSLCFRISKDASIFGFSLFSREAYYHKNRNIVGRKEL